MSRSLAFIFVSIAASLFGLGEFVALGMGHPNGWMIIEYLALFFSFLAGAVVLELRKSDFGIAVAALSIVLPFAISFATEVVM